MPIAVFKCVREVSSEDPLHCAANLLKQNAGKKWKTESKKEKEAYVILELDEPRKIVGIDIGNEHSAFVEVTVSKTGCNSKDFKSLLYANPIMSSTESKNSDNPNRVLCINSDYLVSATRTEKWKLVKITCTQPYNKHVQYGLSFIKLHVAAEPVAAKSKPLVPQQMAQLKTAAPPTMIGNFKLRQESPDSESEGNGAFKRWTALRHSQGNTAETQAAVSTAAAMRDATAAVSLKRLSLTQTLPVTVAEREPTTETVSQQRDRNRPDLMYGHDDDDATHSDAKKQRLQKHIETDKHRLREAQEKQEQQKRKDKPSKRHTVDKHAKADKSLRVESKECENKQRTTKRLSSPAGEATTPAKKQKTVETTTEYRATNELLRGVVLVISGIQNPDRADLRSKALKLGAKYKADWEPGCTHLICAFKNTPKYTQVKGKGKIVTRSWIEKCFALKKYLPWRRYALSTADLAEPESDVEIHDEATKPRPAKTNCAADAPVDEDETEFSSQRDMQVSSGSDTEDELERIAAAKQTKETTAQAIHMPASAAATAKTQGIYEISTDEEDYLAELKQKYVK